MGNTFQTLPAPDEYTERAVKLGRLTTSELSMFHKVFKRIDVNKSGTIPIDEMFDYFDQITSMFTDGIIEFLDIEHDGSLSFGQFLLLVLTYGMFEPDQILRLCFNMFDRDKNGYIQQEEAHVLMNVLWGVTKEAIEKHKLKYGVDSDEEDEEEDDVYEEESKEVEDDSTMSSFAPQPKKKKNNPYVVKGNIKSAWEQLPFDQDGRIDMREFRFFHKKHPNLLYPAFKLQMNIRERITGNENWWETRSRKIQDYKDKKYRAEQRQFAKERRRAKNMKAKRVRKKMGFIKFYVCFFLRYKYNDEQLDEKYLTPEELNELREIASRKAMKLAEQQIKNPTTNEFTKFKTKTKRKQTRLEEEEKKEEEEEGGEQKKEKKEQARSASSLALNQTSSGQLRSSTQRIKHIKETKTRNERHRGVKKHHRNSNREERRRRLRQADLL